MIVDRTDPAQPDHRGRRGFAKTLVRVRMMPGLTLSRAAFARRFGLPSPTLKDLETMRTRPSRAVRVLVAAIELDPALIERAARIADGEVTSGWAAIR